MPENQEITAAENKHIEFHFSPLYHDDNKKFWIEKADSTGKKRMYIEGVASGPKVDLHSERMTEKCVKSFMDQANSGTLLLYPDKHGIEATKDIGILEKAEIMPDGNWKTSFRLYDENDEVDQASVDTARKMWKQLNGICPYKKPMQKGFSVEGYIPPEGILSAEKDEYGNISRRVIDAVNLDGVILVPRPAYQDSIANAVYKALGEMNPHKMDKVRKTVQTELMDALQSRELNDQYYRKKWDVNDALERTIEKIMRKPDLDKMGQLNIAFDEYKQIMVDLLIKSESLFKKTEEIPTDVINSTGAVLAKNGDSKLEYYRSVLKSLQALRKLRNL
jgi:hypothetical protein